MISVYELCTSSKSGYGHTLKLKEDDVAGEDAKCIGCNKSITDSPTYTCSVSHDDYDCSGFYLHKSCAELSIHEDYHGHPLRLIEDEDIKEGDSACFICNKQILAGIVTYTCIQNEDIDCQNFYLHKSCAEFPLQLIHHKHNKHSLALQPAPDCICDVCYHVLKFAYTCDDCKFFVCVFCAFEQRVLSHQGHPEHDLTLIQRESLFTCDACYEEVKDSSYVCITCEFWIHKTCALSPSIIQASNHHHHPLTLVYSVPDMHRYFVRTCNICKEVVHPNFWIYYCQKCTYFAHIKCATSSVIIKEIEADDIDNEPDLVQFPLLSKESLFDLIITQYDKFQADNQGEGESFITLSRRLYNPRIINKHWSHPEHPLEKLQFTVREDDNEDSDDNDSAVLICDGCIQPITVSHPSYYACILCGYFLHSFCAKLPTELPAGASPFHPQHSLMLWKRNTVFSLVACGACTSLTNGFFYHCKICDIIVDIRCAFFPTRIKHISHKHHSLIQRPFSKPLCSISKIILTGGLVYGCESETCSDVHISIFCVFLPSMMKHRFDSHPITLRLPPFFYEGVFYCEICEEQVNNQWALYHCDKSDHSFHYDCFDLLSNIKFGGTIELDIDHQSHTFTFVLERPRKKGFLYKCRNCAESNEFGVYFRCDGCGYLACYECVVRLLGESSPNEFVIPAY